MADVILRSVAKYFGHNKVTNDVSIEIRDGEFFSLLGPSGCGKTTILRLVAGFMRPDAGDILIGGVRVNDTPPNKRGIAMVFQNYALFPHMTVYENAAFGLMAAGGQGRRQVAEIVNDALSKVRLTGMEKRYPSALSGGQQQRVAIARSIALSPRVLLLDEPLSALDRKLRAEMQSELRDLQKALGTTALYVTHDQEEALALSDRIAVLNAGDVVQQGTPQEIYERPRNSFVADFMGIPNILSGVMVKVDGSDAIRIAEGIVLPSPTGGMAAGTEVRLAIRSECVALANDMNGIAGVVTSLTYLGSKLRCVIKTTDSIELVADIPSQILSLNDAPKIGSRINVRIDRKDIVIVDK